MSCAGCPSSRSSSSTAGGSRRPARATPSSSRETPVFDGLVARYPHDAARGVGPGGRAARRPDGQLGGRPPDDRVGPDPLPGPRAGDPRGRGRVVLRERGAPGRVPPREGARGRGPSPRPRLERRGPLAHRPPPGAARARRRGPGWGTRTWIHAFTDGRDVSPTRAADDLATLPAERIATVFGRYYAMDRDKRWERTDRALAAIAEASARRPTIPSRAVRASYERGVTDEFIEPVVASRPAAARSGARRRDRLQLPPRPRPAADAAAARARASTLDDDDALPRRLHVPGRVRRAGGAGHPRRGARAAGRRQLHAAETEKYAHVTYFFNGGVEEPWPGRSASSCRRRATCRATTRSRRCRPRRSQTRVAPALADGYGFCVVNFANPDMVGHTGVDPGCRRGRRDG